MPVAGRSAGWLSLAAGATVGSPATGFSSGTVTVVSASPGAGKPPGAPASSPAVVAPAASGISMRVVEVAVSTGMPVPMDEPSGVSPPTDEASAAGSLSDDVVLVAVSVSVAQAARDLDLHQNMLRNWVREFGADPAQAFPGQGQSEAGAG